MKKFYYQGLEFLVPVEVENYAMAIKRNISFQDQAQIWLSYNIICRCVNQQRIL